MKKKENLVRRDIFFTVCTAYLTVPVAIFMIGNLKPYIGIPAALIMIGCAVFSCLDFCKGPEKKLSDQSSSFTGMKMPLKYLIILAVISGFLQVFHHIRGN